MEARVSHLGQMTFSIRSRSHSIPSDRPGENGGEDTGVTPLEFKIELAESEFAVSHC
jgi:hypothetical protein